MSIQKHIKARRSVRTFDGRELKQEDLEQLKDFMDTFKNPFGIPVGYKLANAKEKTLPCPVVVGTDLYLLGKVANIPNACVAFGYSIEAMMLKAQSLGIGTVWLGGTMDRAAFEKAADLAEKEVMPCATPLGYPADKMSLRETMMRKGIGADSRLPFEELFFDGSWGVPLTAEKAGNFAAALEMVRLAPSAVNKQPWRVVADSKGFHFYLQRSKGFNREGRPDMQQVDMGIALCHFSLTAKELGQSLTFSLSDPGLCREPETEYIASYLFNES